MNIEEVLKERGNTHGDFSDVADAAQDLKKVIHNSVNFDALPNIMKEALDMFASKIARILSGDYNEKDHWLDIQGYSKLVSERLNKGN